MSKDHDIEKTPAKPKADGAAPLKRKRVAGVTKFAKTAADDLGGERIAKAMARAGLCSRREAETWIADGRVQLNGKVLETPAVTVSGSDRILVDGQPMPVKERTRLFLYHKPRGLVTTTNDPEGRPTVFENLPAEMPRVVTVGRLDINTEGLLLLTNDGGLARVLELPATGWLRRYRVRAFGEVTKEQLDELKDGITIEGISYGPVEAEIDTVTGSNVWLMVGLREGKNREVKRILQHLGLTVNRLIRISFGPFQLGDLDDGEVREIRGKVLREQLGPRLVDEAGADFDAPIIHHIAGGEGDEAKPAAKPARGPARAGASDKRTSGDAPRKRTARAHMEFLGTGDDGSRQARLNREGKPSVSVKYAPKSREDGKPPRGRGPRPETTESRGFAQRTAPLRDRKPVEGPERSDRPARAASDQKRPRTPSGKTRFGAGAADDAGATRPARHQREGADRRGDDRPRGDRGAAGERPFRSEGFRDRPAGAARGDQGRGDQGARSERPYRSEGAKDRPSGGLSRGPRGDDASSKSGDATGQKRAARPARGADRPDGFSSRPPRDGAKPSSGPRAPRGGTGTGTGPNSNRPPRSSGPASGRPPRGSGPSRGKPSGKSGG